MEPEDKQANEAEPVVGCVASEASTSSPTATMLELLVVNVQAAPPTDQLNVVLAATEQAVTLQVAPPLAVLDSVPLVHW